MPRPPARSLSPERERRHQRLLVALLLGLSALLGAPHLFAQRVVLVRPPEPDALLAEAFTRLHAELRLQDFEVEVVDATGGPSTPESLAAAAQRADAFAAISLSRRASTRTADVWLVDRVTGKTTLRTLALDRESDAPTVLAMRTVDLLRSSLREYAPGRAPPPEVRGVDRRPIPEDVKAFSAPPPPAFALELMGVMLVQAGELDAAYGPAAAFEYRLSDRFRIGLLLAGPLLGASFETRYGRATVRQELGAIEGEIVVVEHRPLTLAVVLGLGVFHLRARSEVDPPLVAQTDDVTSALGSLGAEIRLALTDHLGLSVEGAALALAPQPGVAVLDDRVLYRMPLLRAGAGLTVAF